MNKTRARQINLAKSAFWGGTVLSATALLAVLFVPPIRNKFFTTKMWPWPTPWDITIDELETIRELSRPGDILLESNLHGWQWIALCFATTGTTWVHAAIVEDDQSILTVEKEAVRLDYEIYLRWGSTSVVLIRPDYESDEQIESVLSYARSKLGTAYDPSFSDPAGNCNGLVAASLAQAGVPVPQKKCLGKDIYAPNCFLEIEDARIIWRSGSQRRLNCAGDF